MLKNLSDLIVHVADLVEAEGRDLRAAVGRLGIGLSMTLVGAVLVLAGSGFVLTAVFKALAPSLGEAWTCAILGALAVALGVGAYALARRQWE